MGSNISCLVEVSIKGFDLNVCANGCVFNLTGCILTNSSRMDDNNMDSIHHT